MAVNWSEPSITKEKVKIEPEVLLEDAGRYKAAGDYDIAEGVYMNALSNARGSEKEVSIKKNVINALCGMYIDWAENCGESIKEAINYNTSKDYIKAERAYMNALSNSRNTNKSEITYKIVTDDLCDMYSEWAYESEEQHDYPKAEKILMKLLRISSNKLEIKEQIDALYSSWSDALMLYDKNKMASLRILIKKIKISLEISNVYPQSFKSDVKRLYTRSYNSVEQEGKKALNNLYIRYIGDDVKRSAAFMALLAILIPALVSKLTLLYFIPILWFPLSTFMDELYEVRTRKNGEKKSWLTIISLLWIIVMVFFTSRARSFVSIGTFIITVLLCLRMLGTSIMRCRAYYAYKETDKSDIDLINEILGEKDYECPRCHTKIKVLEDEIGTIKCPECNSVVRKELNLGIKNKPKEKTPKKEEVRKEEIKKEEIKEEKSQYKEEKNEKVVQPQINNSINYDKGNVWDNPGVRRAAGGLTHLIVKEILKNIRF